MRLNRFTPYAAVGNVGWNSGHPEPFAMWKLPTITGDWNSVESRLNDLDREARALDALPTEWWFLSVERALSPAELGTALTRHVIETPEDAAKHPTYAREVRAWMEEAANSAARGTPPTKRETFLVVRLPAANSFTRAFALSIKRLTAAVFDATEPLPTEEEQRVALTTAQVYESYLADIGPLQPLTPGQQRHFTARLRQRGIGEDPYDAEDWETTDPDRVVHLSWGEYDVQPTSAVGAREIAVTSERLENVNVEQGDGSVVPVPTLTTVTSYQTSLVVSGLPETWTAPGMELTRRCDTLPFPVDIAYLGRKRSNEAALRSLRGRVRRTKHEAGEDQNEWIEDPKIAAAERATRSQFQRHNAEHGPDHRLAIVITIGHEDLNTLRTNAALLASALGPNVVNTERPIDDQPQLYTAFIPGAPQYRGLDPYRRYLHSAEVASLAPRYSLDLGHPYGMVEGSLFTGATSGPQRLVHDAPSYGLREDESSTSASGAILADSGAGKTYKIKTRALHVVKTGDQFLTVDTTLDREWVRAASVMPEERSVQIINPYSGSHTIDPMRVFTAPLDAARADYDAALDKIAADLDKATAESYGFGGDDHTKRTDAEDTARQQREEATKTYRSRRDAIISLAEEKTLGYYSTKVGITGIADDLYTALSGSITELLNDDDRSRHDSRVLLNMLNERASQRRKSDVRIAGGTRTAAATSNDERRQLAYARLYERIEAISRAGSTKNAIFGDAPIISPDADCVIFSLPGLNLPKAETVNKGQMSPAHTDALALLYLITSIMVETALANTDRFTQIALDECHALTENPYGRALIDNALRTFRRLSAGLFLGTQITTDLTDEELDDLIPNRWVGRAQTEAAARRHLRFIGADETPDNISALLASNCPRGTFLRRDHLGRMALVTGIVNEPTVHAAFDTSRRAPVDVTAVVGATS